MVGGLESIGLPEVQARVELQTRVDREYIVERTLFEQLVEDLHPDLRCLTIDGRTGARDRSTYFDTADLTFFYQHLQGRRRRFKVPTRSYLDSDTTLLEVKAEGLRSATGRCATDRWLLDHGIHPKSMSKYCLGIALLHRHVCANPRHRILRRHFDWTS